MKYFVFEDMFAYVAHGIVSIPKADIICVQPDTDDEDLSTVFYWVEDESGKKIVDVLMEVLEFDNLEDAQVWALADLPDFINAVETDKQNNESLLGEMQTMLDKAVKSLEAAEAIVNGPPKPKAKVKKKGKAKKK